MSKKSSARTGSEGDADSTTSTEVFTNIYSESSSCKSKREVDGGPFGDIERTRRNQERFKDFLILMFQENQDQSETSHSTDEDQVLYNLKNDYLEKLNIVRKRLNLVELSNDNKNKVPPLSYSRCQLTEIIEQSANTPKSDTERESKKNEHDIEEKEGCSVDSENMTDTYELNTIYSPSLCCINSADSVSATNIYDLDYNPPKKKFCHRLRTPKFTSASEGNIPYYTKVALREDLFKKGCSPTNSLRKKPKVIKRRLGKFTKSKGIQCTEEEVNTCRRTALEDRLAKDSKDINLFPRVIIEVKEQVNRGDMSLSSRSSKRHVAVLRPHKDTIDSNVVPPINFVRNGSDDESYVTVTTNTTIIDSPKKRKVKKKKCKSKTKITSSEKLTLWDEVRKLHSTYGSIDLVNGGGEKSQHAETVEYVAVNTGTIRNITKYINELSKNAQLQKVIRNESTDKSSQNCEDTKENMSQYIRQYLKYKASLERVKNGVAFGGSVVTNISRFQTSPDNIYYSGTSLISDEDRRSKDVSSEDVSRRPKKNTVLKSLWRTLCPCLAPKSSD